MALEKMHLIHYPLVFDENSAFCVNRLEALYGSKMLYSSDAYKAYYAHYDLDTQRNDYGAQCNECSCSCFDTSALYKKAAIRLAVYGCVAYVYRLVTK